MTDSGNGAVNIQDELGASCATKKKKKERKCSKKQKQSTMVGYVKGTEEPTEGISSDQS